MRALLLCLLLVVATFAAPKITAVRCDNYSTTLCAGDRTACAASPVTSTCTADGLPYATWLVVNNATLASAPSCQVNPWPHLGTGECMKGYAVFWINASY